jgi:hypothetical protein
VPEFHACRCHGKGIKEMMKPMKAKTENSGYVESAMLKQIAGTSDEEVERKCRYSCNAFYTAMNNLGTLFEDNGSLLK